MYFANTVALFLVFLFFLFPAAVVGEVFLGLQTSRWPGVVLPAVFLVLSAVFSWWFSPRFIGVRMSAAVFLVACIPALLLLGVYAICRHVVKKRKVDELKRMEIQDL